MSNTVECHIVEVIKEWFLKLYSIIAIPNLSQKFIVDF